METRARISYKDKYLFWRNAAIILGVSFVIALVFMVRAAKATIDMQAKFISPDGIVTELEVR